jgi:small GTP-binding protein
MSRSESRVLPKVILLGDTAVGKTAIYQRLSNNYCADDIAPTVSGSVAPVSYLYEGNQARFNLWDTAGQEKFRATAALYFRGATLGVLVFSLVDPQSFQDVEGWANDFRAIQGDANIVLIGNKSDLQDDRLIGFDQATEFTAQNHFCSYIELSARTGEGIEDLLQRIATEINIRRNQTLTEAPEIVLEAAAPNEEGSRKKACC